MVNKRPKLTCEEFKSRISLGAHYFDLAEEGEGHAIGGLGECFDLPGAPRLGEAKLPTRKRQHGKVRRAQLSVELLQ